MNVYLPRLIVILLFASALAIFAPGVNADDDGRLAMFGAAISPDGNQIAFSWVGDIWVADIDTGGCSRVTDHVAQDWHPVWFPDGSKIAFTSNRDGNDDIYSVPVAGGVATRHTWYGNYDVALDVSPDGETILMRSYRRLYSSDLFEVDIHGGLPRPVTRDAGVNREAMYSTDGNEIVVCRGSKGWTRRGYNSSSDTDIYVMNRDGTGMRWVENGYDGIDFWPCYSPGDEFICFVSNRDGMENVYRIPSSGGPAEQLTHFSDRPVLFLSIAETGRIAFIQDFHLWIMDPDETPRMLDLDISSEPKHSQEVRMDISGNITRIELSPLSTHIALIARGELYIATLYGPDETVPLGDQRFREAVRITDSSSRESDVAWHPDGDSIVLISDRDGNNDVYEINLRTYEWTRITNTPDEEYLPNYSPDGTCLAYYRGNDKLIIKNTETGFEKVALHQNLQTSPWPTTYIWSPDSKLIAFNGDDSASVDDVFVFNVDDDNPEPVNITLHHDGDYLQGWSLDCESVYFMSSRDQAYGLNGWGSWNRGYSLYNIPLKNVPSPRSDVLEFPDEPEDDETSDDVEEENSDTETEEEPEIEIDFYRIEERARLVSSTRGGGHIAALSPDCDLFVYDSDALGKPALWSVPFEGGGATHIADVPSGVNEIEWLADGSGLFYLTDGKVYYWEKNSGSVIRMPTFGRLTVDLTAERLQMIRETGRILENHFYDPDFHGIDWNEAVDYYTPLVEQTPVPEDFSLLMRMLFGELNASHLGCWTSGSNEGIGLNTGHPGLEFDPFTDGPGLLVTKVWPRGPADYDEPRIEPGEWVLEINGEPVSPQNNYWALLDDSVARSTTLRVASDQNGTNSRIVTLAPVIWWESDPDSFSFWEIIYFDWVEEKRAIVETTSDDRIGYVHISGMSGEQLERFTQELFSENYDKEALIIDVRFNSGGNTHEQLLDILSRPQFGWKQGRDDVRIQQPARRWDRPTILLINERSFSDAEIFPAGFRALGLGTIIGETTAGGVIGTWSLPLVDGITWIRTPRNGWYTIDGENMENLGIEPDIFVEQDLNHIRDGIDDQLNYAIEYLLERI